MGDSSSFGYEDGSAGEPQPPGPIPPAQYRFTPDELRVLTECNAESFVQRSLPLGTGFGLAAYFGVKKGHLKPNARFGAFPKVSLAVIVGYFLGKISYQEVCADKLMALPGSYIGQLLRERKEGRMGGPRPTSKAMLGATPADIYSDAGPENSLDLDTDRPLFGEDAFRSDSDINVQRVMDIVPGKRETQINPSDELAPRPALSYDELRRKNRGDYTETRKDPYRVDPNIVPTVKRSPPPTSAQSTNKYGDKIE